MDKVQNGGVHSLYHAFSSKEILQLGDGFCTRISTDITFQVHSPADAHAHCYHIYHDVWLKSVEHCG